MTEMPSVAVVGAGLAGLVAARRLADAGADVTVFEDRDAVGGRVHSRKVEGFTLDRGFQVLFTAYPAVRSELDLDALDLRGFTPGAVIARHARRSVLSDPRRDPRALFETLFNREVTTTDKARTLLLYQDLAGRSEEEVFAAPDATIREWLSGWGFSEKFVDNFVAPFYGGITLDRSLSASRRVFAYTFKMLSEGSIAVPADGMRAIPEQLADAARAAGATIELGETVARVEDGDTVGVRVTGETVEADACVVATDPPTARELTGVEGVPTEARSCVTQHYRLPEGTDLGVHGRLLLNAEDASPNTVAPMSAVAPEYAPDDAELVSATFLGGDVLDRSEADLAEDTRDALRSWFPERRLDPDVVATDRIEFAQFAQPPGIHDELPGPRDGGDRVYLAGDYTTWSSIQGAMRSGREAADAVLSDHGAMAE